MRNKLLTPSLVAALGLTAGAAQAAPYMTNGQELWKFQNLEQINPAAVGNQEQAWGILQMQSISDGQILIQHDLISGGNITKFSNSANGQITGMFYGLQSTPCGPTGGQLCATGGALDMYWDEPGLTGGGTMISIAGSLPGSRSGPTTYTGYTDGIFLVHLVFASGGVPGSSLVTLNGSSLPPTSGLANGFLDVDPTYEVNSQLGLWANALNLDWFWPNISFAPVGLPGTPPYAAGPTCTTGNTTQCARDLRFDDRYTAYPAWDGPAGSGISGAYSNDPVQVFAATPEPTSLALISLGLLGLGFGMRRKSA